MQTQIYTLIHEQTVYRFGRGKHNIDNICIYTAKNVIYCAQVCLVQGYSSGLTGWMRNCYAIIIDPNVASVVRSYIFSFSLSLPLSISVFFSLSLKIYHHHVALPAEIYLTLSRHPSLSFIAPGRSSRLHPVSTQSCCISVLTGRCTFACRCEVVHRSILLMSSMSCMSGSSNFDSFHGGW